MCKLLSCALQLEDTKHFRQLHSKTPGHPENFITDGVEVTTGGHLPLLIASSPYTAFHGSFWNIAQEGRASC